MCVCVRVCWGEGEYCGELHEGGAACTPAHLAPGTWYLPHRLAQASALPSDPPPPSPSAVAVLQAHPERHPVTTAATRAQRR